MERRGVLWDMADAPDEKRSNEKPFMREKIVKPPLSRRQTAVRVFRLFLSAVIFGVVAAVSFAASRPLAERFLGKEPETTPAPTLPLSGMNREKRRRPRRRKANPCRRRASRRQPGGDRRDRKKRAGDLRLDQGQGGGHEPGPPGDRQGGRSECRDRIFRKAPGGLVRQSGGEHRPSMRGLSCP